MSLPKPPRNSAAQLPKSVKVRSTCNACQQAKIRCSHEKPSCRRCQKHKIDCIYSVSRRLGRPAKKKERMVVDELTGSTQVILESDREKKARRPAKKKNRSQQAIPGSTGRSRSAGIQESGGVSAEEHVSLIKGSVDEHPGFDIDITSGSWLQELMSNRVIENEHAAFPDLGYDEFELEEYDSISDCVMHSDLSLAYSGFPDGHHSSIPNDVEFDSPRMHIESAVSTFHSTATTQEIQADGLGLETAASVYWPYDCTTSTRMSSLPLSDPWPEDRMLPTSTILIDSGGNGSELQSPILNHPIETSSPPEATFPLMLESPTNFDCSCYKQVISELVRFELKVGPNGVSSIDSILACQKELLIQAESILQCKMCSQSEAQANALMVIIVIIDSLLTTLDATALSVKPVILESIPEAHSQVSRRQKELGNCLKTHIDACPLLVGGFQVPIEEKSTFIRQVLQARLSMLLLTVRRIRMCMQQQLAAAFSRGRLLMIMETDRRLQLIMMKIKMTAG